VISVVLIGCMSLIGAFAILVLILTVCMAIADTGYVGKHR
jgi:hypothetical protein